MQEIKKGRQPYMPVVALAPGGEVPSAGSAPVQPTFKYDKKTDKDKPMQKGRCEQVNLVSTSSVLHFAYMVQSESGVSEDELEVLAVSITGCTTSVIGQETADRDKDGPRTPCPCQSVLASCAAQGF